LVNELHWYVQPLLAKQFYVSISDSLTTSSVGTFPAFLHEAVT